MGRLEFSVQQREAYGQKYLKVFLAEDNRADEIKQYIQALPCVRKVNITHSDSKAHLGNTLTIYGKPMYTIEDVESNVKEFLNKYDSRVKIVDTNIISEVKFNEIEQLIITNINGAMATIDVCVAWFTNDNLLKALTIAKGRRCKVRVITVENFTNQKYGVDFTGIEHKMTKSERGGTMHEKYCVIDNNIVIHGSYNWTKNAETKNDEEISVLKGNVQVASKYTMEFNRKWDCK